MRTALALRGKRSRTATSFRVINSESDLLSGLVCDKYEDVLVLQTSALGMDQRKGEITSSLQKLFEPRAIVERNDMASRKFEGLGESNSILMGALDGDV